MRRTISAVVFAMTALAVSAPARATPAGASPANAFPSPAARAAVDTAPADDPWEKANRHAYRLNQTIDRLFLRPAAMALKALTPGPIGKGLHNLLSNLGEPLVVVNDLLQLRPRRAGAATVRFAANSSFGLAGLIDVAGAGGLPHHDSTFGDTLGRYGVKPGPYIFLPLIGPSTARDLVGAGADLFLDPVHFINYPHRTQVSAGIEVVGGLDTRARADADLTAATADAADPYATLRSVYLQHRQVEIEGGEGAGVPSTLPPLPDIDDAAPAGPSADAALTARATPTPESPG